jgi:hypothetical protein
MPAAKKESDENEGQGSGHQANWHRGQHWDKELGYV